MSNSNQTSTYIALLRAVNVGGTGKLSMKTLVEMCELLGFTGVQTYIASGNVLFDSEQSAVTCRALLEAALQRYAGKPVGVFIRTPAELAAILNANPYADKAPNRTVTIFLDDAPDTGAITSAKGRKEEEIAFGSQHIYVHYGDGMADSKLVIPAASNGTARNMNTVAKLLALAEKRCSK
ncbi:DUF1697 domain-containing protein [Undibacterium danionis]|uniref:DUF1697 domain-containing protein n=1 Tax=Undibacterium danionis TaxID=1812100 RepID=A0ABV6ICC0_9BURK